MEDRNAQLPPVDRGAPPQRGPRAPPFLAPEANTTHTAVVEPRRFCAHAAVPVGSPDSGSTQQSCVLAAASRASCSEEGLCFGRDTCPSASSGRAEGGEGSEVRGHGPSPQESLSLHSEAADTPARLIKPEAGGRALTQPRTSLSSRPRSAAQPAGGRRGLLAQPLGLLCLIVFISQRLGIISGYSNNLPGVLRTY